MNEAEKNEFLKSKDDEGFKSGWNVTDNKLIHIVKTIHWALMFQVLCGLSETWFINLLTFFSTAKMYFLSPNIHN